MRAETNPGAALATAAVVLATDTFVYGLAVPVLPSIAGDLGASPTAVGLLFASYAAALLLATPFVGLWIDRSGARTPMLVGLVGLAAATLLFASARTFPLFVLARVLQGISAGVSWTAAFALIAATHPPGARGRAMGVALSGMTVGMLLGPPLGGLLLENFGTRVPFLLAAAVAGADGVARWILIGDDSASGGGADEGREHPARHPDAPIVFALTALGAATIAFLEPILPLHLYGSLGAAPGVVGILFGLATLASAIAYPLVGALSDRLPGLTLALIGAFVGAGAVAATGVLPTVWAVGVALALVAVAAAFVLVPTLGLISGIAEAQDPPAYGAAYALYALAYVAGLTAGPLLGGLALGAFGFGGAALTGGALLALAGICVAAAGLKRRSAGNGQARREHPGSTVRRSK